MSSYTDKTTADRAALTQSANWPLFAALGAGTSIVLTAVGTFWDVTGNDDANGTAGEFLAVVGIIAVATLIVFGLVVRTARPSNAATRALVLGILAVLSLVAFWSGLPAVFAAGAASCALQSQSVAGRLGAGAKTALALSVISVALAVVAAVAG
jgi:hypothetical protein